MTASHLAEPSGVRRRREMRLTGAP
jgi:hypothetical protein